MITKKQILKLVLQIIVAVFTIEISKKLAGHYNLELFAAGFLTCIFVDVVWNIVDYSWGNRFECE